MSNTWPLVLVLKGPTTRSSVVVKALKIEDREEEVRYYHIWVPVYIYIVLK